MLNQLVHNGVIVPEPPEPTGLTIEVRGQIVQLTQTQDEMAQAWARKKDTPYIEDPVFVSNFMSDFSTELNIEPVLSLDKVDFSAFHALVDEAKARKEAQSSEERKALAVVRRAKREALKAKYGYAIVNGQRVELGTYMVEPSGIFMGRGQHPLRGRWKEGAKQSDITLNHSPDATLPQGEWQQVVWQPDSMWVARWKDKLSGKLKYIWLGDTAPVKQEREAAKFDKAIELDDKIELVRAHINQSLLHPDPRRRTIATVCYLIDKLCLRVGDEKDSDEADTVGATTLRPEHVTLRDDGTVEFRFLGKDSVEWHKTLEPPEVVLHNLAELIDKARPSSASLNNDRGHPTRDLPQLFPDVTSRDVNAFLSDILPGVSAKVFRTHHATQTVQQSLAVCKVKASSSEHQKWRAVSLSNYEAAVLCNHTKQYTGNWERSRQRYDERRLKTEARIERYRHQVQEHQDKLAQLKVEAQEKEETATTPERRSKTHERYRKRLATARRRIEAAKGRCQRAQMALGKLKARHMMARKKRTWNLGTSLKSYIDPRLYARWGRQVEYDVLGKYYPSTLRRKFAWVRFAGDELDEATVQIRIRNCMTLDLDRVTPFLQRMRAHFADLALPSTPEAIASRYLPSLESPWREALVALDDGDQLVAFAALGPTWGEPDQTRLDIVAVLAPEWNTPAMARRLASEISRSVQAFETQHLRCKFELQASDIAWYDQLPELVAMLGLDAGNEPDEEE